MVKLNCTPVLNLVNIDIKNDFQVTEFGYFLTNFHETTRRNLNTDSLCINSNKFYFPNDSMIIKELLKKADFEIKILQKEINRNVENDLRNLDLRNLDLRNLDLRKEAYEELKQKITIAVEKANSPEFKLKRMKSIVNKMQELE